MRHLFEVAYTLLRSTKAATLFEEGYKYVGHLLRSLLILPQGVEQLRGHGAGRLPVAVEGLKSPNEAIRISAQSDGKSRQASTHDVTDLLICPIAGVKVWVQQRDKSVASRQSGFDLCLPLCRRFNVVVGNKSRYPELGKLLLDLSRVSAVSSQMGYEQSEIACLPKWWFQSSAALSLSVNIDPHMARKGSDDAVFRVLDVMEDVSFFTTVPDFTCGKTKLFKYHIKKWELFLFQPSRYLRD